MPFTTDLLSVFSRSPRSYRSCRNRRFPDDTAAAVTVEGMVYLVCTQTLDPQHPEECTELKQSVKSTYIVPCPAQLILGHSLLLVFILALFIIEYTTRPLSVAVDTTRLVQVPTALGNLHTLPLRCFTPLSQPSASKSHSPSPFPCSTALCT